MIHDKLNIERQLILRYYISDIEGDIVRETLDGYMKIYDENGNKVNVGDKVKYSISNTCGTLKDTILIGTVKFGAFWQDGSGGEFSPVQILGFYVEQDGDRNENQKTWSILEIKIFEII